MSLQSFKHSKTGALVGSILTTQEAVARMEAKSREGRPAVEAVGARIAEKVGDLDDEEKKLVGRWVKQVLEPYGWTPAKKGRVAPGNLFARGTVYRRSHVAIVDPKTTPRRSAAERVAAARAILATMPYPIMSSEELIADRRREFERDE
ncbi:MAG: hypothetical protein RL481_1672 [Pseudomonadota bacterium]